MNCVRIVICTAALIVLSAQCANAAPALATNNVNMRQGTGHRISRHRHHSGRQHRGHNRLPGRVVHGGLARPKRLLDCNELRPGQRPAARCRRSAPGSGRSATGGCRGRSAAWRCRPAATGRPAAARLSAARCRRSATRLPAPRATPPTGQFGFHRRAHRDTRRRPRATIRHRRLTRPGIITRRAMALITVPIGDARIGEATDASP